MTIVLLVAGFVLLVLGAETLVRGASRLALAMGISPLVVGLTVVAYGTSAPELAVSVSSALSGQAGIAVGNVVGSNIFNVLFILGISALIVPLKVSLRLIRLDVPLMIGVSVLVLVLGHDGTLHRTEGMMLFAGGVIYTAFLILQSRRAEKRLRDEYARELGVNHDPIPQKWLVQVVLVMAGLGMLILGARWLVQGATSIAQYFGISELVIGLTIVSIGTSLPEVFTSVIASIKRERDIAVGNVIGSNIFNILCVLGLSAAWAPEGVPIPPAALRFDIPIMIAVAFSCLPVFFTGHSIARWEGTLFLGYYVIYTLYIVLSATQHDSLDWFNIVMLYFVIPPTMLTLLIMTAQAIRQPRP
jgi:cation:H+ antiporter